MKKEQPTRSRHWTTDSKFGVLGVTKNTFIGGYLNSGIDHKDAFLIFRTR